MMINCPCCGKRYLSEFSYEGDATLTRPDETNFMDNQAWYDYVYARINNKEKHAELWQHAQGCRQFFVVIRDLHTHHIHHVYRMADWQKQTKGIATEFQS